MGGRGSRGPQPGPGHRALAELRVSHREHTRETRRGQGDPPPVVREGIGAHAGGWGGTAGAAPSVLNGADPRWVSHPHRPFKGGPPRAFRHSVRGIGGIFRLRRGHACASRDRGRGVQAGPGPRPSLPQSLGVGGRTGERAGASRKPKTVERRSVGSSDGGHATIGGREVTRGSLLGMCEGHLFPFGRLFAILRPFSLCFVPFSCVVFLIIFAAQNVVRL